VRTIESDQCSSGNTGSVVYTIPLNQTNETAWFAAGRLETNTEFSTYTTQVKEVSFVTGLFQLANIAPFLSLLLFLSLILFFGVSGPTLIVGSLFSLLIISTFLFVSISWGVISSLMVLGGVILYRLRTQ